VTQVPAFLLALVVFAGHLAYGANSTVLALVVAAIWFAILAGLMLRADARAALQAQSLGLLAATFALVLALAALSLTPWALGGPHPVWLWAPGALRVGTLDPYATRLEVLKLLALAAAFLVGCVAGADDDSFRRAMRAILVVGMLYSAWAFIDHTTNPTTLFGVPRLSDPARLAASFGSSNTAATLFGVLTLLNIVDLARTYDGYRPGGRLHISHLQRLIPHLARPLIALVLSASCLVLTFSRAGLAATAAVAVVLIGLMTLGRARRGAFSAPIIATLLILFGLLAAFLAINADMLQQRFLFAGADSLTRGRIFAAHWAAFHAAPWGGYGLGAFTHVNTLIMSPANVSALDTLGAAHNVYLQWLEEAGVPGAAAMFVTVAVVAARLVAGVVNRRQMRSWLLGILSALTVAVLHGMSDFALQVPSVVLTLGLLLGLGAGCVAKGSE
jgi:O-antigen ligase